MASPRATMIWLCKMKMLVLFLLTFISADMCEGKAFREESVKDRGSRIYTASAGLHQTYDSQSNAEHWKNVYEPHVDGQPIYIPSLDQPGSYQEFLDSYYKAYTPVRNPVTPVSLSYETGKTYKNPETSAKVEKIVSEDYGVDYALTPLKESLSKMSMSSDYSLPGGNDYDSPEIIEKDMTELQEQDYEEPTMHESLKKHESPETKPGDYNQPAVKNVKQKTKTNNGKTTTKKQISKTKPQVEDAGDYEKPVILKTVKVQNEKPETSTKAKEMYGVNYAVMPSKESLSKMNMPDDYSLPEYDSPEVIDKAIITESQEQDDYEEPTLLESLKSLESPETKLSDYNRPAVKTVKQKPKTNNGKATTKPISITKPHVKDTLYEKPVILKTVKVQQNKKPETSTKAEKIYGVNYAVTPAKESLSKMNMPDDYSLPEWDDSLEVIDKAMTESQEQDDYEEPTLLESLKKLESPESNPGNYNQYDQPAVVKTLKQKPKTNNRKKSASKKPVYKTKPQVEDSDDYEKPVIHKTIKVKQNKKPVTNHSKPKYGEHTNQSIRKKGKGKRRKQYSKPKIEVAADIENASGLTSKTSEQSKDVYQSELYPTNDKTSEKKSAMTNNPVKTMENVAVNNPQYKPVKTSEEISKLTSKDKPEKTKVSVQRDPPYQPIEIKEKVVINSNSKDKPIKSKEKITLKYENDSEVGQLSNSKDSTENGMSNTDNPLPEYDFTDDLDTEEFSERKLNPEELETEKDLVSESTEASVIEKMTIFPSSNDFRGLPMNSNIWSMLFNPNAEQNRLKQKRCITRSNETGFCTYIQNCEVPQIATSLEKLLNNACVIDEIFIGVCCPEFPVETVKVHWDQTPSNSDNQIEDEFAHNIEDCGIRSNEASELQSWPWKAPLVSMSNGKIFCGGVLVSEDHVLTAAHCTTKIPKNQILVRLGQYDDESGDDYAVVEIKRHAQYNPRTLQNDVALLKLGRKIKNYAHIGAVCLPDDNDENDHDGETATLLGWRGIFGTKSRDPEFLAVMSNEKCGKMLGRKITSGSLCTETRKKNERTCNADSGAPLVIKDDGKYEVIGILSWNRNDCDQRFPSTFIRVSTYTGWIKTHI